MIVVLTLVVAVLVVLTVTASVVRVLVVLVLVVRVLVVAVEVTEDVVEVTVVVVPVTEVVVVEHAMLHMTGHLALTAAPFASATAHMDFRMFVPHPASSTNPSQEEGK